MITKAEVEIYSYIIDTSGIVELLTVEQSPRGRRAKFPHALRSTLIGMLMSIAKDGSATLVSTHRMLTERLSREAQLELDVRRSDGTVIPLKVVERVWGKAITNLTWSASSVPNIKLRERVTRRKRARLLCDQLMDVFDVGPASTSFALDATGIRSWSRGERQSTTTSNGVHRGHSDPEAANGRKTAAVGETEKIFGYQNHVLVRVPDGKEGSERPAILIRRFELFPANKNSGSHIFRMLRRLPAHEPIKEVLVDRGYSYFQVDKWVKKLFAHGIDQVIDLRSDEHAFDSTEGIIWADGFPHCPGTPTNLFNVHKPKTGESSAPLRRFEEHMEHRKKYAMHIHERKLDKKRLVITCPAAAGTVGCPLKPHSVKIARKENLPIVSPPAAAKHVRCCSSDLDTITVELTDRQLKHQQRRYWGTPRWAKAFSRRTYVEGVFGQQRNKNLEALGRGQHQFMGIAANTVVFALIAASYNLRALRNWNNQQPNPIDDHPLLVDIEEGIIGSENHDSAA